MAFAIPGSAILTVALAALSGYLFAGNVDAFFVHGGGPGAWLTAGVMNIRTIYRSNAGDTLIAIPLFIFMGLMLQRSKVADDLLSAMAQLFGAVRGGLGISVILVGALLAATTGVIGATVVAMGAISLPTMLRNNYSKPLATGVVAATGTLGQIIPPSIVLIILVHQLTSAVDQANAARRALFKASTGSFLMPSQFDVFSVSAGEMFMGALVPGLVLVALYIFYVMGCATLRPQLAPKAANDTTWDRQFFVRVLITLIPPLALIILVLGSIIAGVATTNQAGAVGAAGATVMAGYRLYGGKRGAFAPTVMALLSLCAIGVIVKTFNVNLRQIYTREDVLGVVLAAVASAFLVFALCWSAWRTLKIDHTMRRVVEETTKTTSLVFAILLGAAMLTAAFRSFGGADLVRHSMQQLPGGFWGQFTVAMLVIFMLGFFLDFIEITVVVVPVIAPILLADPSANVAAVWLGVMIALNIQTSFLTPPFGFALFYLRGVTPPSVSTIDIYKGVVPFIVIQLLAIAIVGSYPVLVNYLPNRVLLLSHAAPPTTNPRLQYCMENSVARMFDSKGDAVRAAIARARSLDVTVVPDALRKDLVESFDKAAAAMAMMNEIKKTEQAVTDAAVGYRPLLSKVRQLEHDAGRIEMKIAKLKVVISRAGETETQEAAQHARDEIATLTAQRAAILSQVPDDWGAAHKAFSAILKAETAARRGYRRAADEAYRPLSKLIGTIGDAVTLKAVAGDVRALPALVRSAPPSAVVERIDLLRPKLAKTTDISALRKAISDARRALRAKSPEPERAEKSLARAVALLEAEIRWRERAAADLLPQLEAYKAAIADTLGLRSEPRLPDDVAKEVAACSATPRDIFLNF